MRTVLEPGEQVVWREREHPRALRGAAWGFIILTAFLGLVLGFVSRLPAAPSPFDVAAPYIAPVAWGLYGLGALGWVIRPLFAWWRRRLVLTSQRLVVQDSGGRRREMPLALVTSVEPRASRMGGPDGPGSLFVTTMRGGFTLKHVPCVNRAAASIRAEQTRTALAQGYFAGAEQLSPPAAGGW